jgi:hypothetical protein
MRHRPGGAGQDGRLMAVEAPLSHPAAPPPGKRVRADVFGGYTLLQRGDDTEWTLFAEVTPAPGLPIGSPPRGRSALLARV